MIEGLDMILPALFGFAAVLYLWLSVRVSRAKVRLSNNVISYFLFLIGMMVAGSVVMLPLGLPDAPAELAAAPAGPLLALLTLTVIATAIATVVFLRLVVIAGPSFVSFINYLIPVWAVLMGMTFLGERPGWGALVALALILSGIGLSEVGRRRANRGETGG